MPTVDLEPDAARAVDASIEVDASAPDASIEPDANTSLVSLAALVVTEGSLDPAFDSSTTSYVLSPIQGLYQHFVTVTPTAADPFLSMRVNGVLATSGEAAEVSIFPGTSDIDIEITDGAETVNYTISVTRAVPSDVRLPLEIAATSSGPISQ